MFLACVISRFFFFAFILARRRFIVDLTNFETIDFLISIYRVFLIKLKTIILFALFATNLISINELYEFLCETIKIKEIVKSFKLNILNKIVEYQIKEKFRDLEFRRLMNFESIVESFELLSRLSIALIIMKLIIIFTYQYF